MGSKFGGKRSEVDQRKDSQVPGSGGPTKLELLQKTFLAPFNHKKSDSTRIFSDLAPVIMTPRMMNSAATVSSRPRASVGTSRSGMDFATLGRAPMRLGLGPSRRVTSRDLQIVEATDELLEEDVPEPEGVASNVSLLRGFEATIPSADKGRTRRRQMRHVETPKLGLKRLGMSARGMMAEDEDEIQSVASEEDIVVVAGKSSKHRKGRESLSTAKRLGKEELMRQQQEIARDKENLHVRRSLINSEIEEITNKMAALDGIRAKLEQDLLKLQEDELELDDELQGVKERMEFEQSASKASSSTQNIHLPHTTRRRKGPMFLPSEHEELPPGVAFMTLEGHTSPITALDFSEPYGTLVTASRDDAQPHVWDLFSGTEIGRLRGHVGGVKSVQVEDQLCLTGGEDGNVRIWDLRKVGGEVWREGEMVNLSDVAEEENDGESIDQPNDIRCSSGGESENEQDASCLRVLEGHTKAVTALYFEDDCLVTGASDKTLRQWDMTTGQCVMTMDILWAISHPPRNTPNTLPTNLFSGVAAAAGSFSVPAPPAVDGSWDLYTDFVGGVQFWGYGLISGSGDGAVRMWDMRTGQAHRTLHGHTGPITCLQFDEIHIGSGSLDKTVRIWDLRTGGTLEVIKYDYAVTALQFDSRKIATAAGENGVKIYNRTSMQQSSLITNGHTRPVEKLRYMDRYLVTGGRDSAVKIWSL